MNSWLVWAEFAIAVVFLGWVAYHFTVRTLRFVTVAFVVAEVVFVVRYGVTHSSPTAQAAPVDLVNAFTRGLDTLSGAFFQPLLPGPDVLLPGHVGWLVIIVFLAFAYRELEVWAMRWQPPTVDTSALAGEQAGSKNNSGHARRGDSGPGEQRDHDDLVAQLRFRLPAVEVRAPAILPGGSTPNGLASVAENSGVEGSGLAGAVIRVVGMLWPSPRRYQVRVWVKPIQSAAANSGGENGQGQQHAGERSDRGEEQAAATRRVTVDLEDARTGGTIATTTLAACGLDDAAARVAAYVARQIFRADPTTPPWCVGSFDGSDLAALISAKQQAELIHCPEDAHRSRCSQIKELKNAVSNSPGAGVARYELALLYDLEAYHAEALWLHALNRQQYPRFFRSRYRLGMSLEMIANPKYGSWDEDTGDLLRKSLRLLDDCGVTRDAEASCGDFPAETLPAKLRQKLLSAAMNELRASRRQLALWRVMWAIFRHRDERAVLRPYWRLRERQRPHDAARVAELLVAVRQSLDDAAVRQSLDDKGCVQPRKSGLHTWKQRRRAKRAMHITAAITGDNAEIQALFDLNAGERRWHRMLQRLRSKLHRVPPEKWRPSPKAGKTRWLPWQPRTPSWQARYNTACLYAALAASDIYQQEEASLAERAVASLKRAVNDRLCEMERPWDWISKDPDLRCLRCCSSDFSDFLNEQKMYDYPRANPAPDQCWQWACCGGVRTCVPPATERGNFQPQQPELELTAIRQSSRPAFPSLSVLGE